MTVSASVVVEDGAIQPKQWGVCIFAPEADVAGGALAHSVSLFVFCITVNACKIASVCLAESTDSGIIAGGRQEEAVVVHYNLRKETQGRIGRHARCGDDTSCSFAQEKRGWQAVERVDGFF
eukprot:CAMPEP_0181327844 /NCGR_PEP_ID=MMETSP1101-20121128/22345_1 /TAXON_ID=46948 /ORGANISM="Rhodomonas abbreviata, Strain Caron Lab Isolate" /LENGTH=121 /DNA_ID=CAMNT_0023436585 /DNA_START=285 /DNA_END=649 /DNA_ORIENTATION=+